MSLKTIVVTLGKLLLCIVVYVVGLMLGGMLALALGLQMPPMPAGLDPQSASSAMMLESPLFALALIALARCLGGNFWVRAPALAAFAWVTNTLNNQIEASFFGSMASGFWFTLVVALPSCLLVAAAVAWLFPPASKANSAGSAAQAFFGRYPVSGWIWRLVLGAISFMPIYYFFGLLVTPFTLEYYRQGLYGLQIPPMSVLLPVLFLRSVLFFVACLPILVLWQSSRRNLVLLLGLALFYFVGFQALIIANWMPWALRGPHLIEILADELVYALALVLLVQPWGARQPAVATEQA